MSTLKRYHMTIQEIKPATLKIFSHGVVPIEHDIGEWVKHSEAQARIQELEGERDRLRVLVEHAMKLEICTKHDFDPESADYAACQVNIDRYRAALAQTERPK